MDENKSSEVPTRKTPFRFPWWGSILLAAASYSSLKYVIPELAFTDPAVQKLAQAAPSFAPLPTILFLLLAAKQLYDVDTGADAGKKQEKEQHEHPEDN